MFFSFLQKKIYKKYTKNKIYFSPLYFAPYLPAERSRARRHSAAGTAHRLGFSPEKKNWSFKPIRKNSLSTVFYTLPRA